jgi:peptidyl-prolyl cis-trans isomerase D
MAVLNKIRQQSIFLIVIIAMALFAFVFMDVIDGGGFSSNKEQNSIATVNGNDISRLDFINKVENALRNMGTNATNLQAANVVWNNELRSILLREQIESLGLQISDDQLTTLLSQNLSGNPTFSNQAGMFDPFMLQEYLADVRVNAPELYHQFVEFERTISQNALEQTYFNMIRAGLTATNFEGKKEYKIENDKVDFEFVQIPYSNIPDDEIQVTEKDIEDYIKRHAERYQADAAVDIQYVLFEERASSADEAEIEAEINALLEPQISYNSITQTNDTLPSFRDATDYASFAAQHSDGQFNDRWFFKYHLPEEFADDLFALNKGEIYGPYRTEGRFNLSKVIDVRQMADSAQAKHILISWDGLQSAGNVSRTKEQAKSLADSLLNVVRRDNSKFAELALEFSDDPSSIENQGDLGYLEPGSTIEEFDEFIFNNRKGDKAVIETEFGFHVISIEDQKNEQKAIKVVNIIKNIEPSEETLNQTFVQATRFESNASNSDFLETAKSEMLDVRPVRRIGELEENIPGIGNNRSIVNWAFERRTRVGDIRRFNVRDGYAIVQITAKSDKGLMPASEVSAVVTPLVRNEKKAKRIMESVSGNTLEDVASQQNTQIKKANAMNRKVTTIPDAGNEPKVVGAAFGLAEGQTSGLIEGRNGVYMVRVLSKTEAPDIQNYTAFATQVNNRRTSNINTNVFNALKKKARIEDRRANFY